MNAFSDKLRISEWSNAIHLIEQTIDAIDQPLDNEAFDQLCGQLALSCLELIAETENMYADIIMAATQFKKTISVFLLLENMAEKNYPVQACADELHIDLSVVKQAYRQINENPGMYKSEVFRLLNKLTS